MVGMDPEVAIYERKKAMNLLADKKEELAPYAAYCKGGTASPMDQARKSMLATIASAERHRIRTSGNKVKEAELDEFSHAHDKYVEYLEKAKATVETMYKMEAEVVRLDADVREWDDMIWLCRTMIQFTAAEMKFL
jgi:hypothetical protein